MKQHWNALRNEALLIIWISAAALICGVWQKISLSELILQALILPAVNTCLCLSLARAQGSDPDQSSSSFRTRAFLFRLVPWIQVLGSWMLLLMVRLRDLDAFVIMQGVTGLLFVIIGNELPRLQPNSTMGIRLPSTLSNRQNWQMTHRKCGPVWIVCGLVIMFSAFFRYGEWIMMISLAILCLAPFWFSWKDKQDQLKKGIWSDNLTTAALFKDHKRSVIRWFILPALIVAFALLAVFAGQYSIRVNEQELQISAVMASGAEIDWDEIRSVSLEKGELKGSRVWGFGAPWLQMGEFSDGSLGNYTRYTRQTDCWIEIITKTDKIYVLSQQSEKQTEDLYRQILDHTEITQQ